MPLVIADSKGKEVVELEFLRREENQFSFIFRTPKGNIQEFFTRFDVDKYLNGRRGASYDSCFFPYSA
jgi:hypothetical protein